MGLSFRLSDLIGPAMLPSLSALTAPTFGGRPRFRPFFFGFDSWAFGLFGYHSLKPHPDGVFTI
jgi:hypothetical protein